MKQVNFKQDVVPFLIATIGEFIALHYWLVYMDSEQFVSANLLLWLGFAIERTAVVIWVRRVHNPQAGFVNLPMLKQVIGVALITLSEILVWIAWLWVVTKYGHLAGAITLYILMLGEHSMEMSLIKARPINVYLINGRVNFFTLMETLGAVGWMYFHQQGQDGWAVASLLIGLSIEHILQGRELKPEENLTQKHTEETQEALVEGLVPNKQSSSPDSPN
ncbi:MAG: hypothetical protein AAF587_37245 [Bacteroidota bacterium]